jgi:hypothetical protein
VDETFIPKADDTNQTDVKNIICMKHLDLWDIIAIKKEDSLLKECNKPVNEEVMVYLEDHRIKKEDLMQIDTFKNGDIRMKESMTAGLDRSLMILVHLSSKPYQTSIPRQHRANILISARHWTDHQQAPK